MHVANETAGTVSVIDVTCSSLIATGNAPTDIGLNPSPGMIYVPNFNSDDVFITYAIVP